MESKPSRKRRHEMKICGVFTAAVRNVLAILAIMVDYVQVHRNPGERTVSIVDGGFIPGLNT